MSGGSVVPEQPHGIALAAENYFECLCGDVAVSRFGHEAHLDEVGLTVTDDPADPTLDPNFNPKNWTGTVVSGLISSRAECGACGGDWHEGACR